MKIRASTVFLVLGYGAVILLPNHDLLNYLFQGTPLVVWKQFLAVVMIAAGVIWPQMTRKEIVCSVRARGLIFLLATLSAMLVLTSLIMGLSITRVVYGLLGYVGFASMAMFACVVLARNTSEQLFRVLSLMALIGSVGIIADYFLPILDFLPRSMNNEFETQLTAGYLRRAAFLFGASTTVFPFLSFGIVAAAILYIRRRNRQNLSWFLLLSVFSLMAIYLTGSRANLLLHLSFSLIVYLRVLWASRFGGGLVLLTIPFLLAPLLLSSAENYLLQSSALVERYSDVLSEGAEGNEHRFHRWVQGMQLFYDFGFQTIFGHGLGSTVGTIDDGFTYSTHYESSFFQAFYEGGIPGLLLRYFPALFALYVLLSNRSIRYAAEGRLLTLWLIWYCLSVTVAPTAAAYHNQIVYFIACGLAFGASRAGKQVPLTASGLRSPHPPCVGAPGACADRSTA